MTPVPHARSVSIIVASRIGSGFESRAEQGISHFVEHMLFKGTCRRPSYADVAASIERLGGQINALTEPEMTVVWVKVLAAHWRSALDVVADMIGHARFDPYEIDKERRVILDEIGMMHDVPEETVRRSIRRRLWPDHGLGREVAGNPTNVGAFSRDQMRAHARRMFSGSNLVVSIAGNIDPEDGTSTIEKAIGGYPAGREASWPAFAPDGSPSPRAFVDSRDAEQTYFSVAGRGVSRVDPQRYAVDILTAVLGEGMGSSLFEELREKQGLVYEVFASVSTARDCGALVIEASTDPTTLEEAMKAVFEVLRRVYCDGVSEEKLERAREFVKGEIILAMEDTYAVAGWALREQLLETEQLTPDAVAAKYGEVTVQGVCDAAKRLFTDDWPIVAVSGPIDSNLEIPSGFHGVKSKGA